MLSSQRARRNSWELFYHKSETIFTIALHFLTNIKYSQCVSTRISVGIRCTILTAEHLIYLTSQAKSSHVNFYLNSHINCTEINTNLCFKVISGAIIGDGDRKSWDARGPMIWDSFSIFRTNCAILTSYIRANPRTCRGFSRGCCHVAGSNVESC